MQDCLDTLFKHFCLLIHCCDLGKTLLMLGVTSDIHSVKKKEQLNDPLFGKGSSEKATAEV